MTNSVLAIGIDLGGTKIEGVALLRPGDSPRFVREVARKRIAIPREDYRSTIEAITGLVSELEREAGATGTVGIAIPGSLSPRTGTVRNANSTWLNGRPLVADLSRRLSRPVRAANDANCFALSEAVDGAGAGARVVFGVILGTGVGGGIALDGSVWNGINGIGGEWGHTPFPAFAPRGHAAAKCWCGRQGCMETVLSGPALAREYARVTGQSLTAEQIARQALADGQEGERARQLLGWYENRLAQALAVVIDILDPDVIVLGGGLSKVDRLYAALPDLIASQIFSDVCRTRIMRPVHGDASGVRGAAWLGADTLDQKGPFNIGVRE